jgi:hypothetical protein
VELINWNIAKHPMNWIVLFLMVFIGGILAHLLLEHLPSVMLNNKTNKTTQ